MTVALLTASLALPMAAHAAPGLALQAPGARSLLAGLDGPTLVLAAGIFLAVEILLIASVVRLRRAARARPRSAGPIPVHWGWELFWTALPALGLLALGILGAQSLFGSPPEPPASGTPTPVALMARQAALLREFGASPPESERRCRTV
jgi:heme/copper-type cytochrome/quinol oxidase subunit 2